MTRMHFFLLSKIGLVTIQIGEEVVGGWEGGTNSENALTQLVIKKLAMGYESIRNRENIWTE